MHQDAGNLYFYAGARVSLLVFSEGVRFEPYKVMLRVVAAELLRVRARSFRSVAFRECFWGAGECEKPSDDAINVFLVCRKIEGDPNAGEVDDVLGDGLRVSVVLLLVAFAEFLAETLGILGAVCDDGAFTGRSKLLFACLAAEVGGLLVEIDFPGV